TVKQSGGFPDEVYRLTGAGWSGREWVRDGDDPREGGLSDEALRDRLHELNTEDEIESATLESRDDLMKVRKPDSTGESFKLTESKMAAMRQSPLTGKHVDENGEFTPERKA